MTVSHPVQLRLLPDGFWHRRSTVVGYENTTACGLEIKGPYMFRDYILDEEICPLCHSKSEVETGELKKFERWEDGQDDIFFDDDDTPTDPDGGDFES